MNFTKKYYMYISILFERCICVSIILKLESYGSIVISPRKYTQIPRQEDHLDRIYHLRINFYIVFTVPRPPRNIFIETTMIYTLIIQNLDRKYCESIISLYGSLYVYNLNMILFSVETDVYIIQRITFASSSIIFF